MKTHRFAWTVTAAFVGIALMPLPAAADEFCETSDGVATAPPTSTAPGGNAFACGHGNNVDGESSTAIGVSYSATGDYSQAIGNANNANVSRAWRSASAIPPVPTSAKRSATTTRRSE